MEKSSLFGKRVHISGSISKCADIAKPESVMKAREFVVGLVKELIGLGANFVVPVDTERYRESGNKEPICFDWLIWETIYANKENRPDGVPGNFVIGVQHHKNRNQKYCEKQELWEKITNNPTLFDFSNVGFWNMNSKRMERQEKLGDILFTLGGEDGVLYLSNLYLNHGKPVIPINFPISKENSGARSVFRYGLTNSGTPQLFSTKSRKPVDSYLAGLENNLQKPLSVQINYIKNLLLDLEKPEAFAIRLTNRQCEEYEDVEEFFNEIVTPVVEQELNYKIVTIDENHEQTEPIIVKEIFQKIFNSSLVIADCTGQRPNCFIEIGYALRNHGPIMITKQKGSADLPFDISANRFHAWNLKNDRSLEMEALEKYFYKIRNIPPLVSDEVIIP